MKGRDFLAVARSMAKGASEGYRRSAAGRAYYAIFLEARDALARWGLPVPRNAAVHSAVRLRILSAADADMQRIGAILQRLGDLRNEADYQLARGGSFAGSPITQAALLQAEAAVNLLDQLEADAARLAAVVADIRARWP